MKRYCPLFIATTVLGWAVSAASGQSAVPLSWAPDGSIHGSIRIDVPRYEGVVTGQPYSGQWMDERVRRQPPGTTLNYIAGMEKIWRDAQGRVRAERKRCAPGGLREPTPWPSNCPTIIQVSDPVAGYYYIWDSFNRVVHRLSLPSGCGCVAAPNLGVPGPNLVGPVASKYTVASRTRESLGAKTINGVEVNGTRYVTVYSTGPPPASNPAPVTVVQEDWGAPDLQIRMLATADDPLYELRICRFEGFTRAEPDTKLFAPPPGFQIVEETGSFYITWGGM
jgi:hypothetical protein